MLAVHFEKHTATVRDIRQPTRRQSFALIRLLCGGICNTDLELLRGYYNFTGVPGHEFVGEVVAADNSGLLGRRVVGEINMGCHHCSWCIRGLERHCPTRRVLGIVRYPGAFREFLTLPEANLHIVPDSIPTETAVFAEPLAAACEILDQAAIPRKAEVAVLGDGKLGLLISQMLQANGFKVRQFGRHRNKLRIAAKMGITTVVAGKKMPRAEFDWVVDATGSSSGLTQAIEMTRPRGTVFMKSTVHGAVRLDTAPIIVNEITLQGSRCGRFEPALDLLKKGQVNVAEMISDEMTLADAPRAFRTAGRKGVMKILFKTN